MIFRSLKLSMFISLNHYPLGLPARTYLCFLGLVIYDDRVEGCQKLYIVHAKHEQVSFELLFDYFEEVFSDLIVIECLNVADAGKNYTFNSFNFKVGREHCIAHFRNQLISPKHFTITFWSHHGTELCCGYKSLC